MAFSTATQSPHDLLKRYWGYEQFLPLQEETIRTILKGRDSLTILPTGGGKSLCYQLPALMMPGTTVVISPLVALMKDQVDTLRNMQIPAAFINSTQGEAEQRETLDRMQAGEYQLLYVAPERFDVPAFVDALNAMPLAAFIIDEAHCISQWGHDFRPAYRALSTLRERFPQVGIHAFTATATPAVQADIRQALRLKDPYTLIGDFERPNLLYRVQYRTDMLRQVCAVIDRHPHEAGIIYCISRKDVDELSRTLQGLGYKALPYHAGLDDTTRATLQAAFSNELVDIMVATVAFGMGIDRSDVRYVIHTGMPKSIEHYQQEAGRAGRDRLEAECVLLYSGVDVVKWRTIMAQSDSAGPPEIQQLALQKLFEMSNYCQRMFCRHRFLVEYFGQPYGKVSCGHCDCCLGEYEVMEDSRLIAQKILSCVYRLKQRFGVHHVAQVLQGAQTDKIRQFGHDGLPTYGLLAEFNRKDIALWIEQLVNEGFLQKDPQYGSLQLTPSGAALVKGEADVSLARPVARKAEKKKKEAVTVDDGAWTEADTALFQALRRLRRQIASEKRVPPYIVFSDVSLKDMVRLRPTSKEAFLRVRGVGEAKLEELGPRFIEVINEATYR